MTAFNPRFARSPPFLVRSSRTRACLHGFLFLESPCLTCPTTGPGPHRMSAVVILFDSRGSPRSSFSIQDGDSHPQTWGTTVSLPRAHGLGSSADTPIFCSPSTKIILPCMTFLFLALHVRFYFNPLATTHVEPPAIHSVKITGSVFLCPPPCVLFFSPPLLTSRSCMTTTISPARYASKT